MKTIELTQGKVTIVDDDVYAWASKFKWYAYKSRKSRNTWYARRNSPKILGKSHSIHLHREIMSPSPDIEIDHIDRDGLNNRRENLRLATSQQNELNKSLRLDKTSKFRGVRRNQNRWRADIRVFGKNFYLGRFLIEEEDAARAYDVAAVFHHGEFAHPNFEQAA